MTPEQLQLLHKIEGEYGSVANVPDDNADLSKLQGLMGIYPVSDKKGYHYKVTDVSGTTYYFYTRHQMRGIVINPWALIDSLKYSEGHYKGYTIQRGFWTYADVQSDKDYYPEIKDYWLKRRKPVPTPAERIKKIRSGLGLSQREFAELISELTDELITSSAVKSWEAGITQPRRLRRLAIEKIAKDGGFK